MTKNQNRKSAWLLQATDVVQVTGVQGLQQILQIRTILLADGSERHFATIRLAQAGHEGQVGIASAVCQSQVAQDGHFAPIGIMIPGLVNIQKTMENHQV